MPGDWKWSLMGSLSLGEHNSQSTPRWSVLFGPMEDGVASEAARLRKVRTYPELAGPHRRAHLVVLALEVGGRWSCETQAFITQLARAKARNETHLMRGRVEQAWRRRPVGARFLACAAARAVASTMLELPGPVALTVTWSRSGGSRVWLGEPPLAPPVSRQA